MKCQGSAARRKLRAGRPARVAAVVAAGAWLAAAAPAGAQDAGAQQASPQNLTQKVQRETQVQLQSLHPIVDKVMPAVVNVSVVVKGGGDEAQRVVPGVPPNGPNFRNSPFDEFLRRFFGAPGGMGDNQDDQEPPQGGQGGRGGQGGPNGQGGPGAGPGAKRVALGSGFIIDPAGYVVTNNHVVSQAATVSIIFQDNTRHPAKVIGRDAKTDLALLKIDTDHPLPFVQWGDSDAAQVGDWVMAVGNPFGLGGSVTAGIISARGRDIQSGPYDDFLQIDAPINRGNSGGPTFNMAAEVIGINTAIYSPSGGSVGIGFAIPASLAKSVVDQLRQHGKVERGWLGVQIQEVTPEIAKSLSLEGEHGALVADVTKDSPAAKAGITQGDIIRSFNGRAIDRPRDLSIAVAESAVGKPAQLILRRQGKEVAVQSTIAPLPAEQDLAAADPGGDQGGGNQGGDAGQGGSALGLRFAPLTAQLRRQLNIAKGTDGVVVTDVAPDSPAAGEIRPGDIVQSIDQEAVKSPRDAAARLDKAEKSGKKQVLILINREGSNAFVGLSLG